jgi:hypothetical protein
LDVPRRDIEKFQEISGNENYGTYLWRFIQGETRGMDLHTGIDDSSNSTTLEVACPPPGHGRNFRKVLETITHALTAPAVLLWKVLS